MNELAEIIERLAAQFELLEERLQRIERHQAVKEHEQRELTLKMRQSAWMLAKGLDRALGMTNEKTK